MKKLLIFFLLITCGVNLYTQNITYDLSQDDLNLLLGQYIRYIENARYRWVQETFSWGSQSAIDIDGNSIIIDYAQYFRVRVKEYERHLVIADSG